MNHHSAKTLLTTQKNHAKLDSILGKEGADMTTHRTSIRFFAYRYFMTHKGIE